MKIRNGFVSNSSSSSFVVYGKELSEQDFKDLHLKYNLNEDLDNYDTIEKISNITGITLDIEGEYNWVGRPYISIGDDETGAEFRKSVEDILGLDCSIFNEVVVC
jgi:hypothetical protein